MFRIKIPAKCTLSGENLVREEGAVALVTRFDGYSLTLSYAPESKKNKFSILAEGDNFIELILWSVVRNACSLLDKDLHKINGNFEIESTIPPCSGLGFSAALCVAVAEWAIHEGYITRSSLFDFSIELEHMFHKKSNGIDIAGVISKKVIQYCTNKEIVEINPQWIPEFYISSSGEISITRCCEKIVQDCARRNPTMAKGICEKMDLSVSLIKKALESDNKEERFNDLAQGIMIGNECFYDWELIPPRLNKHLNEVKKYAMACKIVGSGLGGHVLSLWKEPPPENLPFKLSKLYGMNI